MFFFLHTIVPVFFLCISIDSLLKAREMTKKGLTKTDISSAEDYNERSKRKCKKKIDPTPPYAQLIQVHSLYL